jgi:hypothetical protein
VAVITVVLWHWGRRYTGKHIDAMRAMLARHLHLPHRIVCITDRPGDVPSGIETFDVKHTIPKQDSKCIRRMWLYAGPQPKGRPWPGDLGDRLLQLDLDVVLTDDITPLIDRPEPFVIWKGDSTIRTNRPHGWAYNATVMLLNAGARKDVWDRFNADRKGVTKAADADGWDSATNSDQAIATFLLKDNPPAVWTQADGIYAYRGISGPDGMKDSGLPKGCRIVSFHGRSGARHPGDRILQERSPWITRHWTVAA